MTALQDVGVVASENSYKSMLKALGAELVSSRRAITDLENAMNRGQSSILQLQLFLEDLSTFHQPEMTCTHSNVLVIGSHGKGMNTLSIATHEEVLEFLIATIKDICGIDGDCSPHTVLLDAGFDSMALVEFDHIIHHRFNIRIDRGHIVKTIDDIADLIVEKISKANNPDAKGAPQAQEEHQEGQAKTVEKEDTLQESNASLEILQIFHKVENPEKYLLIIPGADLNTVQFASWRFDSVQVLLANLKTSHWKIGLIASQITSEMSKKGYLTQSSSSPSNRNICVCGYSYGAIVGLEVCRLMVEDYDTIPHTYLPVCINAPSVETKESLLMKMKKKMSATYRSRSTKSATDTSFVTREARKYFDQQFKTSNKLWKDQAFGGTTLLDEEVINGIVQRLIEVNAFIQENRKIMRHGQDRVYVPAPMEIVACMGLNDKSTDYRTKATVQWQRYTQGPVRVLTWYGDHYFVFDPTISSHFQDTIGSIISEERP